MKRHLKTAIAAVLSLFVILSGISLPSAGESKFTVTDGDTVVIQTPNYVVKVAKQGFRYGFYRPDTGTAYADMHSSSGICFGQTGGTVYEASTSVFKGLDGDTAEFEVTNTNGDTANVGIELFNHYAKFSIVPQAGGSAKTLVSNLPAFLAAGETASEVTADSSEHGGYLHILGKGDQVNATVERLVAANLPDDYTVEADVRLDAGTTTSVGLFAHYNAKNAFHLFYVKAGSIGLKRLGQTTTDFSGSVTQAGKSLKIVTDQWYHLKMTVSGRSVKCYVDDMLAYNITDSSATDEQLQGGCGLRVDKANAGFDNISVSGGDGTSYASLDFESAEGIGSWQRTKWDTMLGSGSAEYIDADGTATAIPAYDPNVNTYLLIKPSSLSAVSVKMLTNADIPDDDYTFEARVRFENQVAAKSSTGLFAHFQAKNAFHLFYLKNGDAAVKRLDSAGTSASLGDKAVAAISPDRWYRMKLVVSGKSIKGYVNDQLMFDANDAGASDSALSGGCGIRVYDDYACIDDLKVYSNDDPSDLYYQNDFESKTLEEVTGDFAEQSDLAGTEDKSAMELKTEDRSANQDAQLTDKYLFLNASPASSAVVTSGSQWDDYAVSADTSFTMSDEQTSDSLVMRYADSGNYYRFGFLASGYVSLCKVQNGTETSLEEVPFSYSYGQTYRLKAELAGNSITCFVDGTEVLQADDDTFAKGTAGILATTTTAKVDSFSVSGGTASFSDTFDGDLADWTVTGNGVISYDGDPSQNPDEPSSSTGKYTIDARVQGNINPMYGLGDYGAVTDTGTAVRSSTNVFGVNRTAAGSFTNDDGGPIRFISNFSVAPQRGFAQVLFEETDKRVVIDENETLLGVLAADQVTTLYYFFGDMKQIYQDYRNVRNQEGYEDTKPHYEMFGLGWEAFGALGWNAYQSNVMSTVQDYLNEGYNITWAVIGSGFWKGDRSGIEGTTTSFGMWDDTADPAGRNDTAQGMPNPRFPDPAGLKSFFKDRSIKLMLGLRVHLKLPASLGGDWHPEVDGTFVSEGLSNGYFLQNEDGSLMTIQAKYPCGNRTRGLTAYLDGENQAALEWYRKNVGLWGVDGFKEDTMVLNNNRTYHDGNWNRILSYLINQDNDVMIMRNGAYALSGDILRINDANYGVSNNSFNTSPDRIPINTLAYAASGVSNVYPDIVGGTGGSIGSANYQKYLVRNAQFDALNPSASVGINVLKMDNESYKQATFNAINWHSTYAPYIYDAALKSWQTGYPYSLTPLYIAYPNDSHVGAMANTSDRQYEWLLGESLLAAPQFGTDFLTADSRDVYLPEGKWIDYSTGETFQGPTLLKNREHPIDNIPAFVGGKGVLVGENMQQKGSYFVEVFPIADNGSTYDYTYIDGKTTSQIVNNNTGWSAETLKVRDTTDNRPVNFTCNAVNHSIQFAYQTGHNYELTGGSEPGSLESVTARCSGTQLHVGQTASVKLTDAVTNEGAAASLDGAAIQYLSSDSSVVRIESNGTIRAQKEGSAEVWASITLNNPSGNPVTVATNRLLITVSRATSGEGSERSSRSAVTVRDAATGVELSASGGILPQNIRLAVTPAAAGSNDYAAALDRLPAGTDTSGASVLEISLTRSGAVFEPSGAVTVTVPVPEGLSNDSVAVYHLKNNGTTERLDSTVNGGKITFRVDSFSKFIIARTPAFSYANANLSGTVDLCRGGVLTVTVNSSNTPDFVRQGNGGVASVNAPSKSWSTAAKSSVWTITGLGTAGTTGIYVSVGGVTTKLFDVKINESPANSGPPVS